DRAVHPALCHIHGAAVEREDTRAERPAILVEHVDAVAMRSGGDCQNVGSWTSAFGDGFGNCIGGRIPEFIHVAFDMARARKRLRNAAARNGKGGSVNVEQYGFGDGEAAIDSEQRRHVSYS